MTRTNIYPILNTADGLYPHVVYNIQKADINITGIVCYIDCNGYHDTRLLDHELTHKDVLARVSAAIESEEGIKEPVYLIAQCSSELKISLDNILEQQTAFHRFEQNSNEKHSLYYIDNEAFNDTCQQLTVAAKELLIADGHHRIKALGQLNKKRCFREKIWLPAIIFPSEHMLVDPFVASVVLTDIRQSEQYIDACIAFAGLETTGTNDWDYEFDDGNTVCHYRIVDKGDDLEILNRQLLLRNTLAKVDAQLSAKSNFVEPMIEQPDTALKIKIKPSSVTDIIELTKVGKILPEKSTFFCPKPSKGIFQSIDLLQANILTESPMVELSELIN